MSKVFAFARRLGYTAAAASGLMLAGIATADVTVGGTNMNNTAPFGFDAGYALADGTGMAAPENIGRSQIIFSAANFSGAQTLSGLRFRPSQSSSPADGWAFSATYTMTIRVATTANGPVADDPSTTAVLEPGTVSEVFAANLGADQSIVFSGDVTVTTDGTNKFDLSLPFSRSFLYDPAKGNLVVDIQVTKGPFLLSGGWPQPDGGFANLVSPVESGYVNFGKPECSTVGAYDAQALSGTLLPDMCDRTLLVSTATRMDNTTGTTSTASLSVKSAGGKGLIVSDSGTINCGRTCTANVAPGTVMSLTASADAGYRFVNWSGACTGTSTTCVVLVGSKQSAQANFTR